MSGHSKWHSIKHKKAAADSKRGKIFTKLIKEMSVAARIGGGDPDANPRLRTAVNAAKAVNMPLDNIKRAIMKGTGELPGQSYEQVMYEGYGPGGAAVLIETLTDNKNRTVAEIRHLLSKHGGNLAETGAVQWIFERKGFIQVGRDKADEDKLMEIILEAGADDMRAETDTYSIYTSFDSFEAVRKAIETAGIETESAEVTMVPQNGVHLEGKKAEQMIRLMELLEDHEDVQNVYANFDIDEAEMEAIANA
jgi:YebC/PmpR family DNA-binding regulatory protein